MGVLPGFSFGKSKVVDPRTFLRECDAKGIPTDWWRDPNVVSVPVGVAPGTGRILMLKRHLDEINFDGPGPPEFDWSARDTENHLVTLKRYTVLRARATSPGFPDDPNNLYLVDVADRRHLAYAKSVTTRAYNLRDNAGALRPGTLNGGAPWTWDEMVENLWPDEYGEYPGLPYDPHGAPESFAFVGAPTAEALENVLVRLGLVLKHDPTAETDQGAFSLKRLSPPAADQSAEAAIAKLSRPVSDVLWDDMGLRPEANAYPETIRVIFRLTCPADGSPPYCWVDVPVTDAKVSGTPARFAAGRFAVVWDDMTALPAQAGSGASGSGPGSGSGSGGSGVVGGAPCAAAGVSNLSKLKERALERAQGWVRARSAEYPWGRRYRNLRTTALNVLGASYHEAVLADVGNGWTTHLSRATDLTARLEAWRPTPCWPCCDGGAFDCSGFELVDSIEEICVDVPSGSGPGSGSQ